MALVSLVCVAVILSGCGSGSGNPVPSQPVQINHVVIIFQENRTPDNLFHDPVLINRGADMASQGATSTGQMVTLTPVSQVPNYDLNHAHSSFVIAWNKGAMNGADLVGGAPNANCPPYPQYQYVQQSDVQPYFTMAETYTFGDRMFQTSEGPSFPAHQYILSGTSAISATSTVFRVLSTSRSIVRSTGLLHSEQRKSVDGPVFR